MLTPGGVPKPDNSEKGNPETVADRVRRLVKERPGSTQAAIARLAGCSAAYVSMVLRGIKGKLSNGA